MFPIMLKVSSFWNIHWLTYRKKNNKSNYSLERYVRAVDNTDDFQYEEVPVEDFYDDGTNFEFNFHWTIIKNWF